MTTEVAAAPARAAAPRRRASETRIDQQPAFVLHTYPWRETSLIVELLTRDHGRVTLAARGAKRPTSQLRGLLAPFCALAVGWSGRGEVKTLMRADWVGGLAPLRGDALLAGFYLNELLVRLLARADAHEALFGLYATALGDLATHARPQHGTLRGFELDLLRELGYGVPLEHCVDGAPVDAAQPYVFLGEDGTRRADSAGLGPDTPVVSGRTLLAMAARDFSDPLVAAESKAVLRQVIRHHLGGKPLNTRRILVDLRAL